jgi:hypothetical protein
MLQDNVPQKDAPIQPRQAVERKLPNGQTKKTALVESAQDIGHGMLWIGRSMRELQH